MTDSEFRKLQEKQLEVMDEIHRLCTENGLRYYLFYGSAIGALRHGGFIPWDFDIDVAMPRPDYEAFREVCRICLGDRFAYYDYHTERAFENQHAVVCLKNTVLETYYDAYNRGRRKNYGILVDIFPIDRVSEDPEEQRRQREKVMRLRRLKYRKVSTVFRDSARERVLKALMRFALAPVSMDRINARIDREMLRYSDCGSGYVRCIPGAPAMPEDWFGTPRETAFEGRTYYIPAEAEKCLNMIYGDYMELPPEDQRQECRNYFARVVFDD